MTNTIKKFGDIALSILLVSLICVPLPAASAMAAEADGSATANTANPATTATKTAYEASNLAQLKEAVATINGQKDGESYEIRLTQDIHPDEATGANATDELYIASGRDVTILGQGHTIYTGSSTGASLAIGSQGGTLSLGASDGTDALRIAADASTPTSTASPLILIQDGGVVSMHDGVTLTNNINANASQPGGAVSVADGTFNMDGGTIENCTAQNGGAVGIVSGTMTMSGNAKMTGNHAQGEGGGAYVDTKGTLEMSGNAAIEGNSAQSNGGGVMINGGRAILTTVYGNSSNTAGDDIFNAGRMKLSPVGADWTLAPEDHAIDGWFYDGFYKASRVSAPNAERWNATSYAVEYAANPSIWSGSEVGLKAAYSSVDPQPANPQQTSTKQTVIWENEDGTVLYRQTDVDKSAIPDANSYTALSGNPDPTEPNTEDGAHHVFDGWLVTHPDEDTTLYIANYKLEGTHPAASGIVDIDEPGFGSNANTSASSTSTSTPNAQEASSKTSSDAAPAAASQDSRNATQTAGGLAQTGDDAMVFGLVALAVLLASAGIALIARWRMSAR